MFKLLCYMVSSARGLVRETKLYGPFRLIDAASRLIEILEREDSSDRFLSGMRQMIEENKYKVMTDREGFIQFLDELVLKMVGRLEGSTEDASV
ncbi:MAG: DUF6092 family protein [Candidatus Bipolaricaulia bacterium]